MIKLNVATLETELWAGAISIYNRHYLGDLSQIANRIILLQNIVGLDRYIQLWNLNFHVCTSNVEVFSVQLYRLHTLLTNR